MRPEPQAPPTSCFGRFSRCGTSYASSATSTTASTTTRIFWRRCFAAIRALFAEPRRLIAAAEAIYGAVVVVVLVEVAPVVEPGAGVGADPCTNALSASVAVIRPPLSPAENETLSMA